MTTDQERHRPNDKEPEEHRAQPEEGSSVEVDEFSGDEVEGTIEDMDRPMALDNPETTAEGQRHREPFSERLQAERSESESAERAAKRQDSDEGLSPEETAMYETEELPGAEWQEGDDYVEDAG